MVKENEWLLSLHTDNNKTITQTTGDDQRIKGYITRCISHHFLSNSSLFFFLRFCSILFPVCIHKEKEAYVNIRNHHVP